MESARSDSHLSLPLPLLFSPPRTPLTRAPAITGLIVDANLICSGEGIRLQAMDNSHVALSSVELRTEGFDPYRCDRAMTIGVSVASLLKIVKSGNNDDILTLRSDDVGTR